MIRDLIETKCALGPLRFHLEGGWGWGRYGAREHNRDFRRRVYSRITSRRDELHGVAVVKTPVYFPHLSLSSWTVTKHLEGLSEAHSLRSVPLKVRARRASVRVSVTAN